MRLSSMADYAVVTMSAAARHCGSARVSAAQLAEETGLPAPTVQKLVSRLTAAGLPPRLKLWLPPTGKCLLNGITSPLPMIYVRVLS